MLDEWSESFYLLVGRTFRVHCYLAAGRVVRVLLLLIGRMFRVHCYLVAGRVGRVLLPGKQIKPCEDTIHIQEYFVKPSSHFPYEKLTPPDSDPRRFRKGLRLGDRRSIYPAMHFKRQSRFMPDVIAFEFARYLKM